MILWLANNINEKRNADAASNSEIRNMLQDQTAVLYLLVWPIMEQHHFSGFMKYDQIEDAANRLSEHYDSDLKNKLEEIIRRFFDRFNLHNENKFYEKLDRGIDYRKDLILIRNILRKNDFEELNAKEKIQILLYVIYRYRNNIFHGNKDIRSWSKFEQQINDCLIGMMELTDCMKNYRRIIYF